MSCSICQFSSPPMQSRLRRDLACDKTSIQTNCLILEFCSNFGRWLQLYPRYCIYFLRTIRELRVWDEALVASKKCEKCQRNHEGLMGSCQLHLQSDVVLILSVLGAKPQCWLTETILSGSISSISQWRVPIQCSLLLLCCDLCHPPIYRTVSGQFLSWKVSLSLPCSLAPTPFLSPLSRFCSVCRCWNLMARSQRWHNVVTMHKTDYPPPHS